MPNSRKERRVFKHFPRESQRTSYTVQNRFCICNATGKPNYPSSFTYYCGKSQILVEEELYPNNPQNRDETYLDELNKIYDKIDEKNTTINIYVRTTRAEGKDIQW